MSSDDSDLNFLQINGGTALLNDKYKYHVLKKYKSGAAIWRCSNYRKFNCLVTITVKVNCSFFFLMV